MRSSTALARMLALAMVVTATPLHLRAQQASSGQTATPSGRGSGSRGLGVREGWARPQGFSVVLVLGDLRAVAGEEDIPPAARKALTDMKDFLPYRSYRLLDAAWILCCSSTRAVTRLRGPDEHEYEIEIESGSADQNRTSRSPRSRRPARQRPRDLRQRGPVPWSRRFRLRRSGSKRRARS
jgi:hypothetical protein